jgi:hypothetical protein
MSGKKIELSIFNPLSEYFKVMSNACGGIAKACSDENFKAIITNKCDVSGNNVSKEQNKPSEKFLNALDLFALNLKTFDYPISTITIKGQLYKIFTEQFKSAKYTGDGTATSSFNVNPTDRDTLTNSLVKAINGSKLLKMGEPFNGVAGGDTYAQVLRVRFDIDELTDSKNEKKLMDKIFESWLNAVFDIYGDSKTRFEDFMNDIKTQWDKGIKEFESTHIQAFNLFFEILKNGIVQELEGPKGFWNNLVNALDKLGTEPRLFNDLKTDTRINIKIVDSFDALKGYTKPKLGASSLKAGIVFALPRSVQSQFNDKLKANNSAKIGDVDLKKNFYKIKTACIKGTYKLDKDQVEKVFKFIKNNGTSSSNRGEPYVDEVLDETEYSDASGHSYSFDELKDYLGEYKNAWAKDYKGDLYTRWYYNKDEDEDKLGKKWTKYTEKQLEKDIESFKTKSGNCGHLCIFDDTEKCEQFFKDMTEGKEITYETLAEMVNGNSFKDNYETLKENIVKVNPAFVIGTLKAFKFEKWEQLNRDGTKTIKVESFTRWWGRKGNEFMEFPTAAKLSAGVKIAKGSPGYVETHSNLKDGKEQLVPVPPENLELFLKLLVAFINNNKFVLNPQSKNNIIYNILQTTSIDPHSDENPEFLLIIEDGQSKRVPNGAYKPYKSDSTVGSLGSALDQIKKNSRYAPIDSNPENRTVLNALLGLSYGWNPYGKLMFSKSLPYSTGLGRIGSLSGGAVDIDDEKATVEYRKKLRPCARAAFDGLVIASKSLGKKGKSIKELNEIKDKIDGLAKLENELYETLRVIGKYEKVINSLDDDSTKDVGIAEMEDEVENYKDIANNVSTRADGITLLVSNLLGAPRSSYSPF